MRYRQRILALSLLITTLVTGIFAGDYGVLASHETNPILYFTSSEEYPETFADDTLRITWTDNDVEISNPLASVCSIDESLGNITVTYTGSDKLNISLQGNCNNGRLTVETESTVNITSKGLLLSNGNGEVINITSKKATIDIQGETMLSDANVRDASSTNKACLYSKGDLKIVGTKTLSVAGNYKHAIQSNKEIIIAAPIKIENAVGDGLKCKKQMTINSGEILANNIANNALSVEKGNCVLNDGTINITLDIADTKGIKTDSLFIQNGGKLNLNLLADQCKGIKALKGIIINNGNIEGKAEGGVVITDGDPSYCTFIKCDSDVVVNNSQLSFIHNGNGGKCISADADFSFRHSIFNAVITGDGGEYINTSGELDYYTPRAIEADDSLSIITGQLDIHCTGIGGKGLVCDHDLTIGEMNGSNDALTINILTEGYSIVNDTIADFRKGCPKAIKSADQLDILSGTIRIKTKGMGGEGLESKNEIWIVGGDIICETFDDGINGDGSINVFGGNIYCCSEDNDGFDSNGSITIYGGNIFSISKHPQNESFDTEGNTLRFYGGNIMGIGGGPVRIQESQIPYYCYSKWSYGLIQKRLPAISLQGCKYVSIIDDDNCIMSGYVPDGLDDVVITIASDSQFKNKAYKAIQTSSIENPQTSFFNNKFLFGGTVSDYEELFELATNARNVSVTSLMLNESELVLTEGETATLRGSVLPNNATFRCASWTSSNPNVASVDDNGIVTAIAEGEATVTATATDRTGVTADCKIIVKKALKSRICVDNVYYVIDSNNKQAEVVPSESEYSGTVLLPDTFTYEGNLYKVTSIGEDAFYGCDDITGIICKAVEPPLASTCVKNPFEGVPRTVFVEVPHEALSTYKSSKYWKDFTNIYTLGDANLSGTEPDVTDFNYTVNYILGEEPTGFFFTGADYNKNGVVNVIDAIAIGRLITNGTTVAQAKKFRAPAMNNNEYGLDILNTEDAITAAGTEFILPISITPDRYSSMQMDIQIPEGFSIVDVTNGAGAEGHSLFYGMHDDGVLRIMLGSLENTKMGEAPIVNIKLAVADDLMDGQYGFHISNILAVTPELETVNGKALNANVSVGDATAIKGVNLSGLKLARTDGGISITSDSAQTIAIRSIDGKLIANEHVNAGEAKTLSLPAGIYIINNKKIVIK